MHSLECAIKMILRHKKIDESSTLRLGDASCTAGGDSNRIVDSHVLRMQHFQHYIKNDRINIDSIPSSFRKKISIFYCPLIRFFPMSFSRKNKHNAATSYIEEVREKSGTSRQSCPAPVPLIKMSRRRNL